MGLWIRLPTRCYPVFVRVMRYEEFYGLNFTVYISVNDFMGEYLIRMIYQAWMTISWKMVITVVHRTGLIIITAPNKSDSRISRGLLNQKFGRVPASIVCRKLLMPDQPGSDQMLTRQVDCST